MDGWMDGGLTPLSLILDSFLDRAAVEKVGKRKTCDWVAKKLVTTSISSYYYGSARVESTSPTSRTFRIPPPWCSLEYIYIARKRYPLDVSRGRCQRSCERSHDLTIALLGTHL